MSIIKNVSLYGEITDITIENGKIAAIGKCDGEGIDFGGARIYPGLIDIHSHGCIGLDAMEGGLADMADWELAHGTTTWYPTTMTMSEEDVVLATSADINFGHGASIPGFHMEGPFINKKFKGAQNETFVVPADEGFFKRCKNLRRITIAPEVAGNLDFIKGCPIQVSIGHTDADYETTLRAFEAGATSLTHTFNAMPGIHHRNPGPIGAASDTAGIFCELICDGKHIHPSSVRMLVKIMGEDRIILVSDSVRGAGLGDGRYMFGGQAMIVEGGTARTESGALAGSTTPLFDCVRCAISFGIPEEAAIKMASENPARLMGLNKGRIEVGYDADFIIVDEEFNLIRAIARGEL